MKNVILYFTTVLIWGSTWLAIEFQLGETAVLTSVFYRFTIAALIMWIYCLAFKVDMTYGLKDHGYIALMALCNFSLNYVLIYQSQQYLTSAMTCIVFSTMLLMNIINTRLFFGDKIAPKVWLGALLGLGGLVVLFWNELGTSGSATWLGLILGLAATLTASFGNMVSVRNSRAGVNVLAANAWGMLYGSLALGLMVLLMGADFTISLTSDYIISLLYLAVFGTVIAFAIYYILLNEMGPGKASYVIVLFPIVAVVLSTIFEEFVWTGYTFGGFVLVLLGNAVILAPEKKVKQEAKPIAQAS